MRKLREHTLAGYLGMGLGLWLAAVHPVQAERLPIKTYTMADGLPSDQISRIVQDSRGFLWFCTSEGLSRFDGATFTNYTTDDGLPGRYVTDLLETRRGVYWVATSGGLCRFNPKASHPARPPSGKTGRAVRANGGERPGDSEARFVVYRLSEDPNARIITALLEDRAGRIWCGTIGAGLYRLEESNGQWIPHLVNLALPAESARRLRANALLLDGRGAVWIGADTGLFRYGPDGAIELYTRQQGGLPGDGISALLEDQERRLWVATPYGLCRLVHEPRSTQLAVAEVYTTKDGLQYNWVSGCLHQSSDGKLWAGGIGLSVSIPSALPTDRRKFRSYSPAHGLTDSVTTVIEDRHGNLWIGTGSRGAMKILRNGFTTYTEADGLKNDRIASIFENRAGDVCVTSTGGLFIQQFDGRRFLGIRVKLPKEIIDMGWGSFQLHFQDHTGEWWVPTWQGLCRFPKGSVQQLAHTAPKAVYTTRDGLVTNSIFRLFEDSHGDLWISNMTTEKDPGLTHWERAAERFHPYSTANGFPQDAPTAFVEDRSGNLWIGWYNGRLSRYREGRFVWFTEADGVPPGQIQGLYLDRAGRLWIASTRGGVARVDDPAAARLPFVYYTTAQGLASNYTSSITEDRWGRLYIATGRGVDRLDPLTGHVRHYTTADGLPTGEVGPAFRDRQGVLWFGMLHGLARLIPEQERPEPPPTTLIRGLRLAGEAYPISQLGEPEVSGLTLKADENSVQIDYMGLSVNMGEALRYQYRMEGVDKDWSAPSEPRTVQYPRLPSGSYRFVVRAVDAEGRAGAPAVVAFTIEPPVWQKGWFMGLVGLGLSLLVYALYRYRVAQLLRLEQVRTRIATDLHDDIGSSLSHMAILSEVAGRRIGPEDGSVKEVLAQIADVSRELVSSMSDIVWAINPQKDRLSDLTQRMRRFAGELLAAHEIEWQWQMPDGASDLALGADWRRQMFLIFKESLHNIVRHAGATRVEVALRIEEAGLTLQLCDNGGGFDPAAPYDGHGLLSMRQRASRLGGQLDILSQVGQGTTVRLRVPRPGRAPWRGRLPYLNR